LGRLHRSLSIEEGEEVALEAVKHNARVIVRERLIPSITSSRYGIAPALIPSRTEMRRRDEKYPKRASAIQFQLIRMSANPFNWNRNRP
jgi:hypothetical protein